MKVGTDGVLLGAWCGVSASDRRALDIGTGTGLIALMLAQRGEHNPLTVDAVEIDADSAAEAKANIAASPWPDSVVVHACPVQHFAAATDRSYDLIVSNPPFFSDSLLPPDSARTAARHTVSLGYADLLRTASSLLAEDGRFCVVIPYEHLNGFLELSERQNLMASRLARVIPKPGAPPKRALIELVRRNQAPTAPHEDELPVELGGRHEYSPEYVALTADFYLKF